MDITPAIPKGINIISAYGKDYIVINNQKYKLPLLVTPSKIEELDLDKFDITSFNFQAELKIIGFADEKYNKIKSFECMVFGAACRTYNVLVSEGRDVICLLI